MALTAPTCSVESDGFHVSACMRSNIKTFKETAAHWPKVLLSCSSLAGCGDVFHWVHAVMSVSPTNELRRSRTHSQQWGWRCAKVLAKFHRRQEKWQLTSGLARGVSADTNPKASLKKSSQSQPNTFIHTLTPICQHDALGFRFSIA